jgi:hypothetical protein
MSDPSVSVDPRRLIAFALLATALLALGACNRKPPQFVKAGADSSAAVGADSFAVLVGDALGQWDSQDGSTAAPATARLLLDDLRRHPDQRLADRARTFVDSCGFSAEVAGGVDLAAASFFSRSDPAGESWPFIFWRDGNGVRFQAIEGGGMRLLDLALRPGDPGATGPAPQQAAAIYGRTSPRGQQPVVIAWRRPPDGKRWTVAQTLGPDSLGGVGTAEFVGQVGGGTGLEARTYRPTAGFDECPTCPHVHRTLTFDWAPEGFRKTSEEVVNSPYYAFVQFIAALSVNDREMAQRLVSDSSLLDAAAQSEWGKPKGSWRLAPGTDESAEEMIFFRGPREAYKVRFTSREGRWLITDLHPTQRSVE